MKPFKEYYKYVWGIKRKTDILDEEMVNFNREIKIIKSKYMENLELKKKNQK